MKNFGEKTEGDKNNNKNNTDNNVNKKPDNYEKAYASVLKDYQDAINKGKSVNIFLTAFVRLWSIAQTDALVVGS